MVADDGEVMRVLLVLEATSTVCCRVRVQIMARTMRVFIGNKYDLIKRDVSH